MKFLFSTILSSAYYTLLKVALICVITLTSVANSYSQVDSIFYYNESWEETSKDFAEFYRISHATYGIFHGKVTNYYMSGKVQMIGNYRNGKQCGEFIWYYENGREKEKVEYTNGHPTVLSAFDSTGKQTILNGHGYHEIYYKNNVRKTLTYYHNGSRDGEYSKWYDNGNKWEEGKYVRNLLSLFNTWDKNGTPMIVSGNGKYQLFYSNGKIQTVGNLKEQKKDGLWKSYYINGKLKEKGFYVNGYKNGKWLYYYDNGKIWSQDSMARGKLIDTKFFPAKGLKEVIAFEDYFNDNINSWEETDDSIRFFKINKGNYIVKTFDQKQKMFATGINILASDKENFRIKSSISLIDSKNEAPEFGICWGSLNYQNRYYCLINKKGENITSKVFNNSNKLFTNHKKIKPSINLYIIEIVKKNGWLYIYMNGEEVNRLIYSPIGALPLSIGFTLTENTSIAVDYIIVSQFE